MGACRHPCAGEENIPQCQVVITFKRVEINASFDPVTRRIRSMPSGAGKHNAECQFSVFVSASLALNQLLRAIFATLLSLAAFFQPSIMMYKNRNRPSLGAGKSSILWNSLAAGGGRNQLSSERFLIFLRTEITLILFTMILLPYIRSVAKYPIPTPIPHLSTASCTYFQRRLCRRDGLSRT